MGLIDTVKDKASSASKSMKYSSGSAEDAVEHISYEIAEDVEAGNFEDAQSTLKQSLDKLMSGEMETDSFNGQGNPNVSWDTPEQEAQHFVNEVYLYLLEMAVQDLEGIDDHLEPPIITPWFKWEGGIKQRIEELHTLHQKAEQAYPDEIIKQEIDQNTPKWYIEEYYAYQNWSENRPNYHTLKDGVRAKVKKWKWIARKESKAAREIREVLGTDQENDHENNGDNMILQDVVRAGRRIEFVKELASWEQENYGLQIDQQELQEIREVGSWVDEREEAIRELDECLEPMTGEGHFEFFENPQQVGKNIERAESVLSKLRSLEGEEDRKLKKLESQLP